MRIPSDRKILQAIYDTYHDRFVAFDPKHPDRAAKILIPIDCEEIARQLRVDPDIVFGRLYYHLEEKYGYQREDDARVVFFALKAGQDRHCVHFPLLAAVLAGLQEERNKQVWTVGLAIAALIVSVSSAIFTVTQKPSPAPTAVPITVPIAP